jgi:hypothetical protein
MNAIPILIMIPLSCNGLKTLISLISFGRERERLNHHHGFRLWLTNSYLRFLFVVLWKHSRRWREQVLSRFLFRTVLLFSWRRVIELMRVEEIRWRIYPLYSHAGFCNTCTLLASFSLALLSLLYQRYRIISFSRWFFYFRDYKCTLVFKTFSERLL